MGAGRSLRRDAVVTPDGRVPLGVWEAADERAASWEESYRELHEAAYRLTHSVGSGEYLRAFEDLRSVVDRHEAEDFGATAEPSHE